MKRITNNLPTKTIIDLTMKTRELSNEGINYLRRTPIHKIAAGTAVVVIPGALTALAAYAIGKKIVSSYKQFKSDENNNDTKFLEWFSNSSKQQIGKNIGLIRNKSVIYVGKVSSLPKNISSRINK